MTEWIKASEALPPMLPPSEWITDPQSVTVLCICAGTYYLGYYRIEEEGDFGHCISWYSDCSEQWHLKEGVTHWLLLPAKPQLGASL